jgi:SAM-dependent methyltransferase
MLFDAGSQFEILFSLRRFAKRVLYFGFRYSCPVCRSRTRIRFPMGFKFDVLKEKAVVGGQFKPDNVCPVCWTQERTRLVFRYLERHTDVFSRPCSLLHVAPEPGLSRLLATSPNIAYVAGDLDPDRYRKNVRASKLDLEDIDQPDESFDVIICNHVLEHVPDDRRAMSEIYRVLKSGGFAILQVPISFVLERTSEDPSVTDPAERARLFGQPDHVRLYGPDYPDRLGAAGFQVEIFETSRAFAGETDRLEINPAENIYIGRKAASRGSAPG